jgi:hypothetical protein
VSVFTAFVGIILMIGGGAFFTLSRGWYRMLAALATQALGLGFSVIQVFPFPIAIAKVITGWIAVGLLALTVPRSDPSDNPSLENARIQFFFRCSLLLFVFSTIIALLPQLTGLFGDPPISLVFAACGLLGIGLLNLGLSEQPLRAAASLLTVLQGFELGYLWIEQSLLVLALLAVTDLAMVMALIVLHSQTVSSAPVESPPAP